MEPATDRSALKHPHDDVLHRHRGDHQNHRQRERTACQRHRLRRIFLHFFFSSRRRHTRWTGDWSSDVCSSDLLIITDGTRIWQRNVPIGGNHFTRALTKELKLTFAKAEHLKRNATKAPDPRSIFTAMRGVFNDFASEVNRSIGFYSSVNRTAKISKIIGLGNGFKLPGLQKFLQQNLSHEVEKLESFVRLVGDDVKTAPQFQENLPS